MLNVNPIHRLRAQRGFTLMELVLAISLLAIMAVVGSDMIVNAFKASSSVQSSSARVSDVRYALDRMAADLREVERSFVTKQMGLTPAASTAANPPVFDSLEFVRQENGVQFAMVLSLDANNQLVLSRSDGAQTLSSTLLSKVEGLRFRFYEPNGTEITTLADVPVLSASMTVEFTVQQSEAGPAKTHLLRVYLRNA